MFISGVLVFVVSGVNTEQCLRKTCRVQINHVIFTDVSKQDTVNFLTGLSWAQYRMISVLLHQAWEGDATAYVVWPLGVGSGSGGDCAG